MARKAAKFEGYQGIEFSEAAAYVSLTDDFRFEAQLVDDGWHLMFIDRLRPDWAPTAVRTARGDVRTWRTLDAIARELGRLGVRTFTVAQ